MRLYTTCDSCKKPFPAKAWARTRPNLQKKKGDHLRLICPHCLHQQKKHINDIRAERSYLWPLLGLLISIGAQCTLMIVYGGGWKEALNFPVLWHNKHFLFISALVLSVPIYFWRQEQNNVHLFNRYFIHRSDKS